MRKLTSKEEICKLPSTTPVFLPRYREACKLPPSPRWSPSQGTSSRSGNSMDSPGPSPRASGSLVCLPANLSRSAPRHLHYASGDHKMVYQHPWYVSSALHILNDRLGVLFISPTEKVAIGGETQLSATDRTLLLS